jgi:N-acetylneuraminate synthase
MTTLFDLESVEKYDSLIQVYKISSSDITNFPLLKSIGLKKKHTIISTGASKISEIKKAIAILNLPKAKICLMHCVLNYPTKDKDANLYFIKKIKKFFPEYLIGYSDHTEPKNDLISIRLAYQLGAKIIEKHFTHNKMLKGNDHYHSANFTDFINFYNILKLEKKLRGDGKENVSNQTRSILNARRSIYIKNDIKPGDKILEKDIISLRPCYGISSIDWNKVIGKKLKKTKKKGEPLYWKDLV